MLEWVIDLIRALARGRYTGSLNVRFKDGGISSITRPTEKSSNALKINTNITAE